MSPHTEFDAVIVGAGPNGLAAAITLARAGCSVCLLEAKDTIGGGMRSAELTLPGYLHDVCSTIHALGVTSPFMRSLPFAELGLEWIFPPAALAHPLEGGPAVLVRGSVRETAAALGADASRYRWVFESLAEKLDDLNQDLLGPFPFPPRHPILLAGFGLRALWPAETFARAVFSTPQGRALFAGMAAHSIMSLKKLATAAFGLMLTSTAHAGGWPLARGGSQQVADAMGRYLQSLGGKIETGCLVTGLQDLPSAQVTLLDVTPRQFLQLAKEQLPPGYQRQLSRYRYGPGVFKLDFALQEPIPWKDAACRTAGTVHLGGTLDEIVFSEQEIWEGRHPEKPFVLLAQQTLFDPSRAPDGRHTVWAYCHTPHASPLDQTETVIRQIERFAPGFRDTVLAVTATRAPDFEAYNPNYVGGDINGGVQDLAQLFTRPTAQRVPYATPLKGVYLCSSSTPPGGGVHGMCGYQAAQAALRYSL